MAKRNGYFFGGASAGIANSPRLLRGCELALVAIAIIAHVAHLANLPKGLFVDETSIGYNAWAIANTGRDEHGVAWPLYFSAFGEYKNPVYIYFLALIYKLFGFSEATTRLASTFCWLSGSALLYVLGRRLWDSPASRFYLLLCLSFTPWLFGLSRVSFELIALYPLLAAYSLAVYRGYEENSPRWVLVAGIAIGVSFYAYSTFRLLAPLHVFIVMACYWRREYWQRHMALLATFALMLVPAAIYMLGQSSSLVSRFNTLTYLNDPTLSLWDKICTFGLHYLKYFGPTFLVTHGDPNLRHHTGFGGALLISTFLTAATGLIAGWRVRDSRFIRFLIAGLLIAPIAAALTTDEFHSLRAFSLVNFAILLSVVGARWLRERGGVWFSAGLILVTALQAGLYTRHYFTVYPEQSVGAFGNFGFKQALKQAVSLAPDRVIVGKSAFQPEINTLFFGLLVPHPKDMPIMAGTQDDVRSNDAYISWVPGPQSRSQFVVQRYADLHPAAPH